MSEQPIEYVQPESAVATSQYDTSRTPPMAFDPSRPLTGSSQLNQWYTSNNTSSNKINVAFAEDIILKKLIINNAWDTSGPAGSQGAFGMKDIILYGTNSETAYLNTVYTNLDDLTELLSFTLPLHIESDVSDPQEVLLNDNILDFKYYVFRCDNWKGTYLGIRQIDMYFVKRTIGGTSYIKKAGHWEESITDYVRVGGTPIWRPAEYSYIKVNGAWVGGA